MCGCVVHFEGKKGEMKQLSNETLKTLVQRRREWLSLEYKDFSNVARNSFDLLPAGVTDIEELPGKVNYHYSCYRAFTDLSKLERAKKSCARRSDKSDFGCDGRVEEDDAPREKIRRSKRQSFSMPGNNATASSSSVLAKSCLICKTHGPIYITDSVSFFKVLLSYSNLHLIIITKLVMSSPFVSEIKEKSKARFVHGPNTICRFITKSGRTEK